MKTLTKEQIESIRARWSAYTQEVELDEHEALCDMALASLRRLRPQIPDDLQERIASAWCIPPNENKVMDRDLVRTIALQVLSFVRPEAAECICPKCGIRHGGSNASADF